MGPNPPPRSSLAILVPCLNEEHGIAAVVTEYRSAFPDARVLVIDNGSTDATASLARAAGAEVWEEPRRGKGRAIATAFERLEEEIHAAMDTTERYVAVAAVPDTKRGERLVILHVAWPDGWRPDRICAALTDRGLPNLWIPGPRDFFAVESMPILGSGKLDLHKLNEIAATIAK